MLSDDRIYFRAQCTVLAVAYVTAVLVFAFCFTSIHPVLATALSAGYAFLAFGIAIVEEPDLNEYFPVGDEDDSAEEELDDDDVAFEEMTLPEQIIFPATIEILRMFGEGLCCVLVYLGAVWSFNKTLAPEFFFTSAADTLLIFLVLLITAQVGKVIQICVIATLRHRQEKIAATSSQTETKEPVE